MVSRTRRTHRQISLGPSYGGPQPTRLTGSLRGVLQNAMVGFECENGETRFCWPTEADILVKLQKGSGRLLRADWFVENRVLVSEAEVAAETVPIRRAQSSTSWKATGDQGYGLLKLTWPPNPRGRCSSGLCLLIPFFNRVHPWVSSWMVSDSVSGVERCLMDGSPRSVRPCA